MDHAVSRPDCTRLAARGRSNSAGSPAVRNYDWHGRTLLRLTDEARASADSPGDGSDKDLAAVDYQSCACNVSGVIGREECDRCCNVVGLSASTSGKEALLQKRPQGRR